MTSFLNDLRSRCLHHHHDSASSDCFPTFLHHLRPHCHGHRHHRGLHRVWRHVLAHLLQLQAQEEEAGPQQSISTANRNKDLRESLKVEFIFQKAENQDIVD